MLMSMRCCRKCALLAVIIMKLQQRGLARIAAPYMRAYAKAPRTPSCTGAHALAAQLSDLCAERRTPPAAHPHQPSAYVTQGLR